MADKYLSNTPYRLPGLKFLAAMVTFGGSLGIIPYTWDWKSHEMKFKSNKMWKVVHNIWFVVLASYGGFLISNFVHVMHDGRATAFMKIRMAYMTILHVVLDPGFLLSLHTYGQHHDVLNQLMRLTARVKGMFGLQINERALRAVLIVGVFGYFFACTNAVSVFKSPRSPRLLTNLWNDPTRLSWRMKLVMMLVHLLLNAGQFFYIAYNSLVMMTYVYCVGAIISRLRWYGMKGNLVTVKDMRRPSVDTQMSPMEIYRVYQELLILQSKFTNNFGPGVLLIVVWMLAIATLNLYQAAIFDSFRSLVSALSACIFITRVFKTCGDIYESSVVVMASWGSIKKPGWFSHFRRATRPARVPIGSFFFFDRGVMPTFMNIILTTAANLIISYRQAHG